MHYWLIYLTPDSNEITREITRTTIIWFVRFLSQLYQTIAGCLDSGTVTRMAIFRCLFTLQTVVWEPDMSITALTDSLTNGQTP